MRLLKRALQGPLILGMGALSRLTGDPKYESAALCALRKLWGTWSSLNLLGTTLDVSTGEWIVYSSGIGAGLSTSSRAKRGQMDEFWSNSSWRTFGMTIYLGATSFLEMRSSGGCFILLCRNISDMVHDPWYIEVGESILKSLNLYTKVEGGFASIEDVTTMQLEDHQHSFFLAETSKYLFLLFDDSFLAEQNYIFTTEVHPLPVLSSWHERLPETYIHSNWTSLKTGKQARCVCKNVLLQQ